MFLHNKQIISKQMMRLYNLGQIQYFIFNGTIAYIFLDLNEQLMLQIQNMHNINWVCPQFKAAPGESNLTKQESQNSNTK